MDRVFRSLVACGRSLQDLVKNSHHGNGLFWPFNLSVVTQPNYPWTHEPCLAFPELDRRQSAADEIDDEDADGNGLKWRGFLWGVPKKRVPVEVRQRRRFKLKYTEEYKPATNLISCVDCGSWHQSNTLCGTCYDKVRKETKAIQAQMGCDDWWNTDKKEAVVVYKDDVSSLSTDAIDFRKPLTNTSTHRVVEMPTNRPLWFAKVLLTRPRAVLAHYSKDSSNRKSS